MTKDSVDPPPKILTPRELFAMEERLEVDIFWIENTARYNVSILSPLRYGLSMCARQLRHTLSELSAIRKAIDGKLPEEP